MSYEIGTTVLAVQNIDERHLNVFGVGEYVGDLPRPGTPDEVPSGDAMAIRMVYVQDDAVPIEEHRVVQFIQAAAEKNGTDATEEVKQAKERIEADRARPMDDRVRELYMASQANPCIHLESGDIVWGFQCWWGPVEQFEERIVRQFPDAVRHTVPVPTGNGKWK